ncbi:hypothetical protein VTK26DRAFT_9104 [Humicola hyalothermophila]
MVTKAKGPCGTVCREARRRDEGKEGETGVRGHETNEDKDEAWLARLVDGNDVQLTPQQQRELMLPLQFKFPVLEVDCRQKEEESQGTERDGNRTNSAAGLPNRSRASATETPQQQEPQEEPRTEEEPAPPPPSLSRPASPDDWIKIEEQDGDPDIEPGDPCPPFWLPALVTQRIMRLLFPERPPSPSQFEEWLGQLSDALAPYIDDDPLLQSTLNPASYIRGDNGEFVYRGLRDMDLDASDDDEEEQEPMAMGQLLTRYP